MASEPPRTALLVDWGGVLTTNLFVSFGAFCEQEGLAPETLAQQFRSNPEGRALLIAFEEGRIKEPEFERSFAEILGVGHLGLIDRLFAGVGPDEAMVAAVRAARAAGVRTGLISNSWGTRRYPREAMEDLFDGIVISGEVGMRKPAPEMYVMGAARAGVEPAACVYVDDLPFNLPPAQKLGMATVHHLRAEDTVPELERLLGVALGGAVDAGGAPGAGAVGSGR